MAYPYRQPYNSRDEGYANNPNRLNGGIINGADSRGSLVRRFTTNSLSTLSPIGQQRRQAAGDTNMVSTSPLHTQAPAHLDLAAGGGSGTALYDSIVEGGDFGKGMEIGGLGELLVGSDPSPRGEDGRTSRYIGKKCKVGAVGEGRPQSSDAEARWGKDLLCANNHRILFGLTPDHQSTLLNKTTPSERKILELQRLLEQQRNIAAELTKFDDETRREVEQGLRHERAVSDMIAQSEPTTPPEEYHDIVPSVMPRSNRYSTTSLTSPPGIISKPHRGSTHLTSPPIVTRPYTATTASNLPSQSVPGSRRQSDDEEEVELLFRDTGIHRSAAKPNRNSMPVSTYDRKRNFVDRRSLNTTNVLFDDEEQPSALLNNSSNRTSPPDTKTYLQVQHTADGFPKLIRRGDNSELLTGSSAALDLAFTQPANAEQQVPERGTGSRHRISLPPSALTSNGNIAPLNSILATSNDIKAAANSRRSLEVKFTAETKRPALMASPHRGMPNGLPKSQSSYSTNDIPTLKSIDGEKPAGAPINSPSSQPSILTESTSQDQSFVNLDRQSSFSATGSNHRQSQDFAGPGSLSQQNLDLFNSFQATLQGNAAPFGTAQTQDTNHLHSFQSPNMPYGQPAYYGGYGMHMLNNGFNNMNMGGGYSPQGQWANQIPPYQQVGVGYGGFPQYPPVGQSIAGAGRFPENQKGNTQQRKAQAEDLYNSISLPDVIGEIYGLCKDQHGCRFLQRKLEERNEKDVQIIFNDVKDHFAELMVDPFGNYLCQRLLEYTNDEQRTVLVENAVPAMTKIALNQHGTRALQRMIESITTQEQTGMIIEALRYDVVQLIQDLNGNHVIQKCLNHLSSQDAQFIFDAVGANCVTVGTHRHGCCVLQRCVDHASGMQKGYMVDQIIANAFSLVQDPFGNYVVQYILDLGDASFTEPLCRSFRGNVAFLSKQKFSSNVIEKCIRCAPAQSKREMIAEIIPPQELERLLRDSFANYVIQTAMEYADPEAKAVLMDNIRPMLHIIRNTPHGRRIQGKLQDYDAAVANASPSNCLSPESSAASLSTISMPFSPQGSVAGRGHRMGMVGAPPQWNGDTGFHGPPIAGGFANGDIAHPAPQRNGAHNLLNGDQNGVQNYPNQVNGGQNGSQNYPNQGNGGQNGSQNYPNQGNGGQNGGQNYPNQGYGGQGFQNFSRPYGRF